MDDLPVYYTSQRNFWMTSSVFKTWFHTQFVPSVKASLSAMGQPEKALLLLDNCSAHPEEAELMTEDGAIRAIFLPPNVTALIQPMDQGVIELCKRRYRAKLCEALLLADDSGINVIDFLKSIDMAFVVENVATAWTGIQAETIKRAW